MSPGWCVFARRVVEVTIFSSAVKSLIEAGMSFLINEFHLSWYMADSLAAYVEQFLCGNFQKETTDVVVMRG